jgi:hypothetical protein
MNSQQLAGATLKSVFDTQKPTESGLPFTRFSARFLCQASGFNQCILYHKSKMYPSYGVGCVGGGVVIANIAA